MGATLETIFERDDIDHILTIPISIFPLTDQFGILINMENIMLNLVTWVARRLSLDSSQNMRDPGPYSLVHKVVFWRKFWSSNFSSKILFFFFQLLFLERLPYNSLLRDHISHLSSDCHFYNEKETMDHIFFSCHHAIDIWVYSPIRLIFFLLANQNVMDTLRFAVHYLIIPIEKI